MWRSGPVSIERTAFVKVSYLPWVEAFVSLSSLVCTDPCMQSVPSGAVGSPLVDLSDGSRRSRNSFVSSHKQIGIIVQSFGFPKGVWSGHGLPSPSAAGSISAALVPTQYQWCYCLLLLWAHSGLGSFWWNLYWSVHRACFEAFAVLALLHDGLVPWFVVSTTARAQHRSSGIWQAIFASKHELDWAYMSANKHKSRRRVDLVYKL